MLSDEIIKFIFEFSMVALLILAATIVLAFFEPRIWLKIRKGFVDAMMPLRFICAIKSKPTTDHEYDKCFRKFWLLDGIILAIILCVIFFAFSEPFGALVNLATWVVVAVIYFTIFLLSYRKMPTTENLSAVSRESILNNSEILGNIKKFAQTNPKLFFVFYFIFSLICVIYLFFVFYDTSKPVKSNPNFCDIKKVGLGGCAGKEVHIEKSKISQSQDNAPIAFGLSEKKPYSTQIETPYGRILLTTDEPVKCGDELKFFGVLKRIGGCKDGSVRSLENYCGYSVEAIWWKCVYWGWDSGDGSGG